MRIVDLHDPRRVDRKPDDVRVLLASGSFEQEGFCIIHVELRHYAERTDANLGAYSLITSYVETDRGSVEMIYDEGFRGEDPLDRAAQFLVSVLGMSGLILRSIITLKENLDKEENA